MKTIFTINNKKLNFTVYFNCELSFIAIVFCLCDLELKYNEKFLDEIYSTFTQRNNNFPIFHPKNTNE